MIKYNYLACLRQIINVNTEIPFIKEPAKKRNVLTLLAIADIYILNSSYLSRLKKL